MSFQISEKIQTENQIVQLLKQEISKVIVGQNQMIDRLLIALLANGHILLEGVPGLAKTLTISTVSRVLHLDFARIQFTPDLMPSDIILVLQTSLSDFIQKYFP